MDGCVEWGWGLMKTKPGFKSVTSETVMVTRIMYLVPAPRKLEERHYRFERRLTHFKVNT